MSAFSTSESLARPFLCMELNGLVLMLLVFSLSKFPERLKEKKYAQQEQVTYKYMTGVVMQTNKRTDI